MIVELGVAFVLILAASCIIYLLGRLFSAKSMRNGDGKSAYACGEKADFRGLKINISYYRYLIYFVILDSSVLLAAFASMALRLSNVLFLILYLLIVFISGLLLLEGGDH
ncbi:MAG: NADH-quinone oxidoreductase subunit A [Candidatus Bathyarchaeia archaeon]